MSFTVVWNDPPPPKVTTIPKPMTFPLKMVSKTLPPPLLLVCPLTGVPVRPRGGVPVCLGLL